MLALIFWAIFAYVVITVRYPETITQASLTQLGSFFAPLILALVFSLKLILKSFYKSIVVALGIVLLLVLKSLEVLNFITTIITISAVVLLMGSFKKQNYV